MVCFVSSLEIPLCNAKPKKCINNNKNNNPGSHNSSERRAAKWNKNWQEYTIRFRRLNQLPEAIETYAKSFAPEKGNQEKENENETVFEPNETRMVADNVMQSRLDGISAEGVRDQYADGRAAKVWEVFIGDRSSRTDNYKNFLLDLLRSKGCQRILDVATGTG